MAGHVALSAPLLALCAALALVDALVSWRILAARALSGRQKGLQIALVWLVPVLGAIVCAAALATSDDRTPVLDGTAFVESSGADASGLPAHADPSFFFDGAGDAGGGGDGGH